MIHKDESSYSSSEGDSGTEVEYSFEEAKERSYIKNQLKTIDEVYLECAKVIEDTDLAKDEFKLSFDENGILSKCRGWWTSCEDDCGFGVSLWDLNFGSRE